MSSLAPKARSKVVVSAMVNMVFYSFNFTIDERLKSVVLPGGQGLFKFQGSVDQQTGRDEDDECHGSFFLNSYFFKAGYMPAFLKLV
jgi:hypothetical protein